MTIIKSLKPIVDEKEGVEVGDWWKFEGRKSELMFKIQRHVSDCFFLIAELVYFTV